MAAAPDIIIPIPGAGGLDRAIVEDFLINVLVPELDADGRKAIAQYGLVEANNGDWLLTGDSTDAVQNNGAANISATLATQSIQTAIASLSLPIAPPPPPAPAQWRVNSKQLTGTKNLDPAVYKRALEEFWDDSYDPTGALPISADDFVIYQNGARMIYMTLDVTSQAEEDAFFDFVAVIKTSPGLDEVRRLYIGRLSAAAMAPVPAVPAFPGIATPAQPIPVPTGSSAVIKDDNLQETLIDADFIRNVPSSELYKILPLLKATDLKSKAVLNKLIPSKVRARRARRVINKKPRRTYKQ